MKSRQTPERLGIPGRELECLVHLPAGYDAEPGVRWPLILFLHGASERGYDVQRIQAHGIPRVVEELELPFITVSPQCPPTTTWVRMGATLLAVLDQSMARYRVDPERVYLTGLSMGGFGAWTMAAEHPDRFAAMAVVCGGGLTSWAPRLRTLPIWAFHGSDDDIVPVSATLHMVRALEALRAPIRHTIYPNTGHDAWTRTYANPHLYTWFLDHRRTP
jgi:predicted peptidase